MTDPGGHPADPLPHPLSGWPVQSLTLVLGSARSGKSALAEAIIRRWAGAATPVYIATAETVDEATRNRIAGYRNGQGKNWTMVEAPMSLPAALMRARAEPVVADCLTQWLSNLMLADRPADAATDALITALQQRRAPTVLVANEAGPGPDPATPLGKQFREAASHLNHLIAAEADAVVSTAAGLPIVLKGPDG